MKKLFSLICCITLFFSVAYAEEKDFMGMTKEQVQTQGMNIYDASVSYPYPSWFSTGLVGDVYKKQNGGTFIYEQIPTGQSFDNWKEIYAVYGLYTTSDKVDLDKFIAYSITPFVQACGKDNLKIQYLFNRNDNRIITIYCGKYLNNPKQGEIGVFRFTKFENTYFKIYQEWKTNTFDVNKLGKNPIDNFNYKDASIKQSTFENATIGLSKATFIKSLRPIK